MDVLEIHVALDDGLQSGYLWPVARHVQPLLAHVVLTRAQIKSEKLGESLSEVCVPMGVHREPRYRCDALSHHAFDRGACLAL
jgi:hypothetical protein